MSTPVRYAEPFDMLATNGGWFFTADGATLAPLAASGAPDGADYLNDVGVAPDDDWIQITATDVVWAGSYDPGTYEATRPGDNISFTGFTAATTPPADAALIGYRVLLDMAQANPAQADVYTLSLRHDQTSDPWLSLQSEFGPPFTTFETVQTRLVEVGEFPTPPDPDLLELRLTATDVRSGTLKVHAINIDAVYATPPYPQMDPINGAVQRPTVGWRFYPRNGFTQTGWEVQIFAGSLVTDPDTTGDTPVADSGKQTTNARGWATPDVLPLGTYRAFLRLYEGGNGWEQPSDWVYVEFEITGTAPSAPGISAVTPDDANARCGLTITQPAGAERLWVQRSADAGTTWTDIAAATETAGDWSYSLYDDGCPLDTDIIYRARAGDTDQGDPIWSDWSASPAAVQVASGGLFWLRPVHQPDLCLIVEVPPRGIDGLARRRRTTVFEPVNSATPVTVHDVPGPRSGRIVIRSSSITMSTAIEQALAADSLISIAGPDGIEATCAVLDWTTSRLSDALANADTEYVINVVTAQP